MTLNDLKDQFLERTKDIATRLSENESVIQLKERYQNMSPLVQKTIIFAGIFFVGYMFYSVPAAYIDSAKAYEETFETNRGLLRGLFRAARNPQIPPDRFAGPDFTQMKSRVEGFMASSNVLETQKGTFAPAANPLPTAVVPRQIKQEGMTFELKKLNLKQVVGISEQISSMHPNTKLAGLEINADAEDPHYFNVKYTLSSLSLPMKAERNAAPNPKRKR